MAQEEKRYKLVSEEESIDSFKDLGLTTRDAINELVDNSFDASCNNIWISITNGQNGLLSLIIEDDGEGIPADKIEKILAFGGRVPRSNSTGKYGWGLSAAACCQATKTEVYSKSRGGDRFYFNYLDLGEIKQKQGYLPKTVNRKLPSDKYSLNLSENSPQGTVIILNDLYRPEKKKADTLETLIKENLAEVHRKILATGKKIYVNGQLIKFYDPLMLMNGFNGIDECGKGTDYAEIEPIVFENVKDKNGKPSKIEIKISKLPVKTIMQKNLQDKFKINVSHQGFYLIRHGRQIAGGLSLWLFTPHNDYNYFRAEITFPPSLDEKFGVQTNKSRFSLDDDLREELSKRLEKVISQIRKDIDEDRNSVKAEKAKKKEGSVSTSEKIASAAAKRLAPSGYKPSKERLKEELDALDKEKRKEIEKVKKNKNIPKDVKEELIKGIEARFQKEKHFNKVIDVIGTGEFYQMKHKGTRIDVIINESHGFYKKIYERATQDPYLQVMLDLFIFTLAQAEDQYFNNEQVRKFYSTQRREWSSIMSTFLEEADEELEE